MNWIPFDHGGRTHRFPYVRADGGVWMGWPGGTGYFTAEAPGETRRATPAGEIRAPMTGKVVRLPAVAGAVVKEKDIVAVLEAMKMEYRLTAPFDGVVERVNCTEGQQVDLGLVLLVVKKP